MKREVNFKSNCVQWYELRNEEWCEIEAPPEQEAPRGAPAVMGDIADFLSPLDFKTVISGRRQRREYMQANGLRDYEPDSSLKPAELDSNQRREDLQRAWDKHHG